MCEIGHRFPQVSQRFGGPRWLCTGRGTVEPSCCGRARHTGVAAGGSGDPQSGCAHEEAGSPQRRPQDRVPRARAYGLGQPRAAGLLLDPVGELGDLVVDADVRSANRDADLACPRASPWCGRARRRCWPILGSDSSVSSRHRYIEICRPVVEDPTATGSSAQVVDRQAEK